MTDKDEPISEDEIPIPQEEKEEEIEQNIYFSKDIFEYQKVTFYIWPISMEKFTMKAPNDKIGLKSFPKEQNVKKTCTL